MGLRTKVSLVVQAGFGNTLDDLAFDRSLEEILDTMDDIVHETGLLASGEAGREITLGDVQQARLIYIESDGDVEVQFTGSAAAAAQITGSGGTFPTGFTGGETLLLDIDGTAFTVTFDDADETLTQVSNRVNSAAALNGLSTPVAADSGGGQLRITSPTKGTSSKVEVTGGTGLATLGLTNGQSDTGEDADPNTAPVKLSRMADPSGTQIVDLKAYMLATVVATQLFISNQSQTEAARYRVLAVGDLTSS